MRPIKKLKNPSNSFLVHLSQIFCCWADASKKLQLLGYHCNKQSKTSDSLVDYVLSFLLNVGSCISDIVLFCKMCDYFLMQFVLVPCRHALPSKVVESWVAVPQFVPHIRGGSRILVKRRCTTEE